MQIFNRIPQKGASALEFALVFPVLFLILYGMISYALIFAAQHSLSQAAAEGARTAVRFQSSSDKAEVRKVAACDAAQKGLGWLGHFGGLAAPSCDLSPAQCVVPSGSEGKVECVMVSVVYDYASHPLLPALPLLPVPAALVGQAVIHVSLTNT